jgi:hypothetical protein
MGHITRKMHEALVHAVTRVNEMSIHDIDGCSRHTHVLQEKPQ